MSRMTITIIRPDITSIVQDKLSVSIFSIYFSVFLFSIKKKGNKKKSHNSFVDKVQIVCIRPKNPEYCFTPSKRSRIPTKSYYNRSLLIDQYRDNKFTSRMLEPNAIFVKKHPCDLHYFVKYNNFNLN